nr:immunoglobulin light chain junction region [Macaca mulatta]
CGLGTHLPYSF